MGNGVVVPPSKTAAGISILINVLFSWTLLPFVLPPFRSYSMRELSEVLLWQGMGLAGWPLGLAGGLMNLLLRHAGMDWAGLLLLSMYPVMTLSFVLSLFSKRPRWWVLALLHIVLAGSFALVWCNILNGYDWMKG
jgi:hypothetical protein